MPHSQLDRFVVRMEPLKSREHKRTIEEDHISPESERPPLSDEGRRIIDEVVQRIRDARANQRPVVVAFGAHAIKNGLGPVFLRLVERG
ncbi:MAG: hypothetical protein QGF59_33180, partial [Pirellulaceae bacterium]|nr:hypothetical protein [Pirellulaceae bacterium]